MPLEKKLNNNLSAFAREKYFKTHLTEEEQKIIMDIQGDTLSQKIFNFINNIETPRCYCGQLLKFVSFKEGYRQFCSNSCKSKKQKRSKEQYERMKASYKDTMINRYGVENSFQLDCVIEKTKNRDWTDRNEKSKQVWLKKYGVDNPNKCKDVIEKRKRTNKLRYGNEFGVQCKENRSKNEMEIYKFLYDMGFNVEHTRKIIAPYELDIYLPDFKLAIEYNGDYWHALHKIDHIKKLNLCNQVGVKLIQIRESDYSEHKDEILTNILNLIFNRPYTKDFFIFSEQNGIKLQDAFWPPQQKYLGMTPQEKVYFGENCYLDCGKYILI